MLLAPQNSSPLKNFVFTVVHLCLVYVLLSVPSLNEMKTQRHFSLSFCSPLEGSRTEMNVFIVLETNVFCAGDEPSSAGDECVENAHSNFNHAYTHRYK